MIFCDGSESGVEPHLEDSSRKISRGGHLHTPPQVHLGELGIWAR